MNTENRPTIDLNHFEQVARIVAAIRLGGRHSTPEWYEPQDPALDRAIRGNSEIQRWAFYLLGELGVGVRFDDPKEAVLALRFTPPPKDPDWEG
jgi:hypothetical protein